MRYPQYNHFVQFILKIDKMLLFGENAMDFTGEQRAFCTATFDRTRSAAATKRKFFTKFKRPAPSKDTIKKWHLNFIRNGSCITPRKAPPATVATPQVAAVITRHFEENQHDSIRKASLVLNMKTTSVHKVLHKEKFHPYKQQILQKLKESDRALRKNFAQAELCRIQTDSSHLSSMVFSDEAHFHLDGKINKQNFRCWSRTNPSWIGEGSHHSPRTTVWAAIGEAGIYGPFFIEENINSNIYLKILQDSFWPAVEANGKADSIKFMQDGAPPHFALTVRSWLDEKLPNRWMGRGSSSMPWPPRSPDLTPCDFFLWGYIKSKVYSKRCRTLEELRARIGAAFGDVSEEMCRQVMQGYGRRLQRCLENDGDHVEARV